MDGYNPDIIECLSGSDPLLCKECVDAVKDFNTTYDLNLTDEEMDEIRNSVSTCEGSAFEEEAWQMLMADFMVFDEPGNPCEQELFWKYPREAYQIYLNSITATAVTYENFDREELDFHLDCADAFRHAYFNALNAHDVGVEIALLFSDAHECNGTNNDAQMDYFNNQAGHSIGFLWPVSVLTDKVCAKLEAGLLKILEDEDDPDSQLINSFGCTCN